MRKWMLWAVAAGGALLLMGCAGLSAEQRSSVAQVFAEMLAEGQITQGQYDTLMAALQDAGGDWWMDVVATLAEIGVAVGGSLLGVRWWRGSTTARKGALPLPGA